MDWIQTAQNKEKSEKGLHPGVEKERLKYWEYVYRSLVNTYKTAIFLVQH